MLRRDPGTLVSASRGFTVFDFVAASVGDRDATYSDPGIDQVPAIKADTERILELLSEQSTGPLPPE